MKEKTTPEWLVAQQASVGISDKDLAIAMGYDSPKVIAMFKSGGMRLPVSKVPVMASALQVSPGLLMRRVLNDSDAGLLQAIEHCLGVLCLSEGEQKLIAAVRRVRIPGAPDHWVHFDLTTLPTPMTGCPPCASAPLRQNSARSSRAPQTKADVQSWR